MAGNNSTPAGQVDAIEEQKTTIAALCAGAANDAVRNCLRKYDPTKTSYQIERELKKDKKDVLVETLNYLGITGMGQFRADALPHELVCRVQNLLPDTCHLCKQTYCIQVGEKPIMSCVKYGQGCHNPCILQALDKTEADLNADNNYGAILVNPYAALGLFYVCNYCQKDVIPNKDLLKVRQTSRINSGAEPNPNQLSLQIPSNNDTTVDMLNQADSSAENGLRTISDTEVRVESLPINDQQRNTVIPICKHYRAGRCKHGVSGKKDGSCKFSHPKPCNKFLKNGNNRRSGCTRGENCNFFHPQICHSSMRERECLRENCKFMHLRGTKRSEDQPLPGENRGNVTQRSNNSIRDTGRRQQLRDEPVQTQ